MKNLDNISKELFNKIRGRFPNVEIGDKDGTIINDPTQARYFDFGFNTDIGEVGKVSVSLDEENGVTVIIGKDIIENQPQEIQNTWYDFLKELRVFSKKRLLNFDVRDINRSNLKQRDYKFLAANRPGEDNMNESKMYGTNKTSFLNVGNAKLKIKHSAPINPDLPSGRTQHVESIYIESPEGERFKYPYKHLSGAKAMARHVSEGGKPYDDFGKHVVGLSEELANLKTFKRYMGRGGVMAESLSQYMDVVNERIVDVKKTIDRLQKQNFYGEAILNFETTMLEEVPNDVVENWVDQLTIKQFNEELKDVFPYIYKLVGEASRAKLLSPEDLVAEDKDPCWKNYKMVGTKKKGGKTVPNCVPEEIQLEQGFESMMGQFADTRVEEAPASDDENIEEAEKEGYGTVYMRFVPKKGQDGEAYLAAFANFANEPIEVNSGNSLRQYFNLTSKDDIAKAVKSMLTDKVFINAKDIGLYKENGTVNRFPQLKEFFEWMNTYKGNKIKVIDAPEKEQDKTKKDDTLSVEVYIHKLKKVVPIGRGSLRTKGDLLKTGDIVQITSGEYAGHTGAVQQINRKQEKEKGTDSPYSNVDKRDIKAPEPKMTRYFTLGNTRLFNYLRREKMDLMQKYFRPNFGGFVMNDAAFKNFLKLVKTGDMFNQFGDPQINIDQNKSFAEDIDVEEGFKSKLAMLALLGLTGLGAMKLTDPTNSPLGQALQSAAQQGDQDAAMHLKKLGAYIDGGDSKTLRMLNFQYLEEPEAMKDNETSPTDMEQSAPPKTPLGEFILSYFDREAGKFPKGETAVLTAVEKDYGRQFIKPASQFIKQIESTTIEHKTREAANSPYPNIEAIKNLAGI